MIFPVRYRFYQIHWYIKTPRRPFAMLRLKCSDPFFGILFQNPIYTPLLRAPFLSVFRCFRLIPVLILLNLPMGTADLIPISAPAVLHISSIIFTNTTDSQGIFFLQGRSVKHFRLRKHLPSLKIFMQRFYILKTRKILFSLWYGSNFFYFPKIFISLVSTVLWRTVERWCKK